MALVVMLFAQGEAMQMYHDKGIWWFERRLVVVSIGIQGATGPYAIEGIPVSDRALPGSDPPTT